jgi:hypothetical protein
VSTTWATLGAMTLLTVGLGIALQLGGTHPRVRSSKKRATSEQVDKRRANKALTLGKDDDKGYKFPCGGQSPGKAFQAMVIENSGVPLVITGENDQTTSKGWYDCTYTIPLTDSWTRLQRHLDALQSYCRVGIRPELRVSNDVVTLRVTYRKVVPSWAELTPYLRADMTRDGDDKTLVYLTKFQRFRVSGGSEAGKSPTAKNIALALGKLHGVRPILSNPQSYSNKNYWGDGFDVEARTHPEQYELILSVAQEVIDRGEKSGAKPYRVYIFDELDSTVAFLDMKELKRLKSAVMMIIKQASHQNICVLFLGQTSAANLLPGTTKSDWMSLVTVAIGTTGYDAVSKSPCLTAKRKSELTERYELMMRKAESANRNTKDKALWVRPAVVFDPTSVELVILPAFC